MFLFVPFVFGHVSLQMIFVKKLRTKWARGNISNSRGNVVSKCYLFYCRVTIYRNAQACSFVKFKPATLI